MSDATRVQQLAALTWQEAERVLSERPVGLLPVGAIEAHGSHLPLDTDVVIAEETARRAALRFAETGIPALVLPAIVYGVSFVGTCFSGTSPASRKTFEPYLASVLTHLAGQGYRSLAICNAHLEPAHAEATAAAAAAVAGATGVPVVFPDQRTARWSDRLSEEFRRGARHAGSYETSLMLAVRPEAVRRDEVGHLPPVWIDLPERLRAGARTFAEAGSALGYFGDPAQASAEEGQRLFDALGEIVHEATVEALARDRRS